MGFLSVLDRLSPGEAEKVARRAKQAVVGVGVAKMSRSDATKVHPPLPMTVQAELAAGLSIDSSQLPAAALATFKHAASLANPKFYELQRLRKSTWDTPRFLRGYDITLDGRLGVPRGLRHTVAGIVEDAGSRLVITDTRDAGREIEVSFTVELTSRQSAAVSAMLAHDAPRPTRTAPPRRPAGGAAGCGEDRHGLCGDRRARNVDSGARRP